MTDRAKTTHLRIDAEINAALVAYAAETGTSAKVIGSMAIAEFLKERGVDIEYPRRRAAKSVRRDYPAAA
jgi:hypothetical protein